MRFVAEESEDARHEGNEGQDEDGKADGPPDSLPEESAAFGVIFSAEALADEGIDEHEHAEAEGDEGEREQSGGAGGGRGIVANAREHEGVDEHHGGVGNHLGDGWAGQFHQLPQRVLVVGGGVEGG